MYKISKVFTVLFAFSLIAFKLNAGAIITTVAGNGSAGDTVTDTTSAQTIAASKAITRSLSAPTGVAVDSQGNVYIADTLNNKIKKLDLNGNLTDMGGSFSLGKSVVGMAADASGNLYVADYNRGLIKKRDSFGNYTTIAGDGGTVNTQYSGPIAAAGVSLVRPMGMALDQSGNLYIADKGNSSIRKLQLSSSFISTTAGRAGTLAGRDGQFSGDGSQAVDADLKYCFGVAVDTVRNVIYIADTYNHRIRKVDSLGVITTVAGSVLGATEDGTIIDDPEGFRGDGGPATSAMLDNPTSVAVDSAGNLYIADLENNRIRKVDTNGIITTVAGTGDGGHSGDGGEATSAQLGFPHAIACDSSGNLYIADTFNNVIRKITFASAPTISTPTSASVGPTSATLGGNVTATGSTSLTAVGVVYSVTSTNSNPQLGGTRVTNVTNTAATGVFTVNATGLSAGTAYSYAAYATNTQGTAYTTVGTFTTTVPTPTLTFTTPSTASVAVGATRTNAVSSTLSGGSYGAITYTSSQTSKATVNATTGVVTGVAVGTTTITATQAAASGFNASASTSYTLTVTIGTPTITTAPTTTGIAFGQTLASSTLSGGTASVPGTFAFTTPSTAPGAGTASQDVTFTPTDTTNYTSTTTPANVTVAKATPTISAVPTASGITYGQTLASSTLSGGTVSTVGTFTFTTPSTAPNAGTAAQGVAFTPTSTANYNAVTTTVNVTVAKATPTVTWSTPSAITFGTALSATQLNATGSVAGTIAYSPASGTTPSAGTQTLTATFTPTDTANYDTATRTVSLVVGKATPTLTWATPSAITYGTALSATQLNASGSVTGSIVYSPASGTTPSAGTQTLTATFTPTDTTNYNTATGNVPLTVNKATPTITWATPSTITYGTALSATQLNATASAAGTITYSPASGTTPSAGTQTLTATFTPTDTTNYNTATGTVPLTVNKATPTITWATPSTIIYGTALSATQLNATASAAGTITYSPASGSVPSVGTQTLSASFTPTDSANYNSASASVSLNVIVAVPGAPTSISATTANGEATVTFTAPSNPGSSAITGYTIRATASDGSAVTVNATGSPAKVTGLTPGESYRFTVTANNSAGSSDTSTTSDRLTISYVNQTIAFTTPTDRTSNSGSFTLAATASSGLPVTFTVVSGPALLTGNVLDLTGAAGTVSIRASQGGNTTYAAAPVVDVSFNVTAGNAQVVLSSVVNPTTQKSEGTLGVVLAGNSRSGVLLMVASGNGPSGAAEFTLGAGGAFTASFESSVTPSGLPFEPRVQAASIAYTFTGTYVNNVLTGSIQPLGYGFKAEAPVNPPASTTSVGLYTSAALSADSGTVYSLVGANNEVLVLVKTPTVTTGGLTTLKPDGSYTLATTTTSGSVTLNGRVNPTTTTTTATLTLPGNTKVDFSGLSTSTKRTDRLINLSSRAKVGTGESVLITGFVIGGTDSKKVLIRAAGPALASFGLASTLPNPTIKIYQGSNLIAQNDDWSKDNATEIARLGAFAFTVGSKDAALLATLAPGAYTSHISDPSGTGTGVALAEIYDASINPNADFQRLVNISSRGRVTPDDGVLIGGFVVTGNSPKTLLIRGIGPALTNFGIAGALADPALTIYQDSKAISTNEGWANSAAITTAAIQTGAFMLPTGSKDAAVVITLNPGAYTAQIKSAKNASSGVALIEIYEVP